MIQTLRLYDLIIKDYISRQENTNFFGIYINDKFLYL